MLSCTVTKLWPIIQQFLLATGEGLTLTASLVVIRCKYRHCGHATAAQALLPIVAENLKQNTTAASP